MSTIYTPDKVMLEATTRDWVRVMMKSKNDPEFMRGFRKWQRERRAAEKAHRIAEAAEARQ